jgi:prevent-host-death family protein
MQRIGVRELRQHASRYLASVKAGETVEVTERGRLIALLVPPKPGRNARERLIAEGRLQPGTGRLTLPQPVEAALTSDSLLEDLRAER